MEEKEFLKLLDDLNNHLIDGFAFSIEGYGHYRHCEIAYVYDEYPMFHKKVASSIRVLLAKNEYCLFYGPINLQEKIFHIKGEGKKSLKYMIPRINLIEIYPKQ